ncbi:hypothetical protein L1887_19507 [Cichorium endivia]|nr:hypothetical protein L1887_19507 [Cichorium endivia]
MSSSSNKIVLWSFDGEFFEMEESEARLSVTITNMIEDGCAKPVIPIPSITGRILSKVTEYCRKHANTAANDHTLRLFDSRFINVDEVTLVNLGKVAMYPDIKSLFNLICEAPHNIIKNKTKEEICELFNIE